MSTETYNPPKIEELRSAIIKLRDSDDAALSRHRIIAKVLVEFEGKTVIRSKENIASRLNARHAPPPWADDDGWKPTSWDVRKNHGWWIVYPGEHRIARQEDGHPFARVSCDEFEKCDRHDGEWAKERIAAYNEMLASDVAGINLRILTQIATLAALWKTINTYGASSELKPYYIDAINQTGYYIR